MTTDNSGYEPDVIDIELALRGLVEDLDRIPGNEWIEGGVGDIGRRLAMARWIKSRLDKAIVDMSDAMAETMETDDMVVPGFGALRRTAVPSSRWWSENSADKLRADIRDSVVASLALDVATGEIDEMKRAVAGEAINRLYQIVPAFSTVKSAGRTVYGIDIDEYRERTRTYRVELYEDDR